MFLECISVAGQGASFFCFTYWQLGRRVWLLLVSAMAATNRLGELLAGM